MTRGREWPLQVVDESFQPWSRPESLEEVRTERNRLRREVADLREQVSALELVDPFDPSLVLREEWTMRVLLAILQAHRPRWLTTYRLAVAFYGRAVHGGENDAMDSARSYLNRLANADLIEREEEAGVYWWSAPGPADDVPAVETKREGPTLVPPPGTGHFDATNTTWPQQPGKLFTLRGIEPARFEEFIGLCQSGDLAPGHCIACCGRLLAKIAEAKAGNGEDRSKS